MHKLNYLSKERAIVAVASVTSRICRAFFESYRLYKTFKLTFVVSLIYRSRAGKALDGPPCLQSRINLRAKVTLSRGQAILSHPIMGNNRGFEYTRTRCESD
jgi:hypothetical protein